MADTKKEYTSNLHPKGDMDTTVYPNVKSENIVDKDTTAYTSGKVPDSSLVSKSLDGLNEKIETNKIQTDTNKTNIATLQGDVSSLKQDNETTKTTIAGLVSSDTTNKANIAKNTQDIATNTQNIENISAVMPTDINVDSDFNLVLEHDGKVITGQKKLLKFFKYAENGDFVYDKNIYMYNSSSAKFKEFKYIFNSYNHRTYNGGIQYFENEQNSDTYYSGFNIFIKSRNTTSPYSIGFLITKDVQTETCTYSIKYVAQDNSNTTRSAKLPNKSGTIAFTSDLDAKQSTLYRHTVKISKATDDGKTSITFTTSSQKNTPIDSIQDLTTVFGNTDLSVSGATFLISSSQWEFYNKIHVGTSINDTTVDYINIDDVGTYNFTDMFGTTGFTITDNVTAM